MLARNEDRTAPAEISPVTKGTIQANRRTSRTEGASFFVSGHIHEKWNLPQVVEKLNETTYSGPGTVETRAG